MLSHLVDLVFVVVHRFHLVPAMSNLLVKFARCSPNINLLSAVRTFGQVNNSGSDASRSLQGIRDEYFALRKRIGR